MSSRGWVTVVLLVLGLIYTESYGFLVFLGLLTALFMWAYKKARNPSSFGEWINGMFRDLDE